jgi:very-short-patch-repair endonuclease
MWLAGFIADFASPEARLVVEVDGGQHDLERRKDEGRTAAMAAEGYRVLRFWNHDVLENVDGVLTEIAEALPSPSHPLRGRAPPSPQLGEGL